MRNEVNTNLFVVQSSLKQTEKWRQTEAVHVVDLTQVTNDKEQLAALLRQRQVSISFLHISHMLFSNRLINWKNQNRQACCTLLNINHCDTTSALHCTKMLFMVVRFILATTKTKCFENVSFLFTVFSSSFKWDSWNFFTLWKSTVILRHVEWFTHISDEPTLKTQRVELSN